MVGWYQSKAAVTNYGLTPYFVSWRRTARHKSVCCIYVLTDIKLERSTYYTRVIFVQETVEIGCSAIIVWDVNHTFDACGAL